MLVFFVGIVALGGALAAAGYIILRARAGERLTLPLGVVFRLYLYLISGISLVVMMFGLGMLLNTGFGSSLGKDFSYEARTVYRVPEPPPSKDGIIPARPPENSVEDQRRQRETALDREWRKGLLNGIILAGLGGLIFAAHWAARWYMEAESDQRTGFLSRSYLTIMLLTLGIGSIVALTTGLTDLVRYVVEPRDEFTFHQAPGGKLALAIVFVPFWFYFLLTMLRGVRSGSHGTSVG